MIEFLQFLEKNKEWLFSGAGVAVVILIVRLIFLRSKSSLSQEIKSGDNSTNIQVGRDINIRDKSRSDDVDEK